MTATTLYVGTRKGAFRFHSTDRRTWATEGPYFLGCDIHHVVADPRDGRTVLMAARTGHLGPTLYRSTDGGREWKEAERPPAFAKSDDAQAPAVKNTFWLEPGPADQPGVWYAGTVPFALFRSTDGGNTWDEVTGFRRYVSSLPGQDLYFGETPGGYITHSVRLDPRDADHLYVSLSTGGTFETTDGGDSWRPLNKGISAEFFPDDASLDYGHDPHCLIVHPANPDVLYQQNHCGIYRMERPGDTWARIGDNMPNDVGDIGFPVVPHPRDADTVWVFPMDGTTVWPRTSPGGKPAVYKTQDGGQSWQRQDSGLPRDHAYWTVLRQAMTSDDQEAVGLYFGTTSGEVWGSTDAGATWSKIAGNLPYIQSVTVAGGR